MSTRFACLPEEKSKLPTRFLDKNIKRSDDNHAIWKAITENELPPAWKPYIESSHFEDQTINGTPLEIPKLAEVRITDQEHQSRLAHDDTYKFMFDTYLHSATSYFNL